jgi:hypothetical protein
LKPINRGAQQHAQVKKTHTTSTKCQYTAAASTENVVPVIQTFASLRYTIIEDYTCKNMKGVKTSFHRRDYDTALSPAETRNLPFHPDTDQNSTHDDGDHDASCELFDHYT